jgi:hypothetical protein
MQHDYLLISNAPAYELWLLGKKRGVASAVTCMTESGINLRGLRAEPNV